MKQKLAYLVAIMSLLAPMLAFPTHSNAQLSVIRPIIFPVIGNVGYSDDFGDGRSGGRTHEGNDLMGKKMLPLVAVVDGTISFVNYPQPTWGYAVGIRDSDGYSYWYLHMNNDVPGTDNGLGDGFFAYSPDIQSGNKVVKGQQIGWMGDSGNAEGTAAHLHFEIHQPNGDPMNPYQSLKAAPRISAPVTNYPVLSGEILPYDQFAGGTNIAVANFDKDTAMEITSGAGPSGGPLVKVWEKSGTIKTSWYAYDASFTGGIDVAAGDVDGDGVAEIITAPQAGGGPHVKIFKADGKLFKEFFAYDLNFTGGIHVTAADMDGDGKAEIITAPASRGGPHVRVFKADGSVVKEFMAYDPNFTGGLDVAAVSAAKSSRSTSSSKFAIITAPQAGGGPHVKIFNSGGSMTKEFMAYDSTFHGGVRLSTGASSATSTTANLYTMPTSGGGPNLKTFNVSTGSETASRMAGFEIWWRGGYDVAAGSDGTIMVSSMGGRRTSIRPSTFGGSSGSERRRSRSFDND